MTPAPVKLTTYPMIREGAERLLVLLHGWSAEQHHLGGEEQPDGDLAVVHSCRPPVGRQAA